LEGQAERYLANQLTQEVLEGYVRNDNSKAPHFVIPIQDGYFQLAYWVKQLPNSNAAGYPKEYHPTDAPYVGELYAGYHHGTNDDDDTTVLALHPWVLDLLTGPSARYVHVCQWIQSHGNWHTVAEVMRFRELEHQHVDTRAHIDHLQTELAGIQQAQDASRGQLELNQLPWQISHL
jgi:hypothetical protein